MTAINIYLDESGDLGWKFNLPYLRGGSSRYLTIASLVVPRARKDPPKRVVKRLYKKHKWKPNEETKWADMTDDERIDFSEFAVRLIQREPDIKYYAIVVQKENVDEHIRNDPNKLYNYMIQMSLLDEMAKHEEVIFIPDPRAIKVASGNSLHDYLSIKLWFDKNVKTKLTTVNSDSSNNLSLQFSDMLSGLVQSHFEWGNSDPWNIIREHIHLKTLYFNDT